MNTVIQSNGEILTGKVWRKQHPSFNGLPFYSNIPRMDEMAGPLQTTQSKGSGDQCFWALLVVRSFICFIYSHIYPFPAEIWSGAR
jgi:hypothetical protein